jgi:hypothetical protein
MSEADVGVNHGYLSIRSWNSEDTGVVSAGWVSVSFWKAQPHPWFWLSSEMRGYPYSA